VHCFFDLLSPLLTSILGDYQFDIYRLMRKHNGDCWADFRPLSNVMVGLQPRLCGSIYSGRTTAVVALFTYQATQV
jgi:hypothetical protein